MLQAIEEEHFNQLPGGVFNRGFIRAYAKHLGLNSEDAVTDYLACLRKAQIDSHDGWDAPKPVATQASVAQNSTVAAPAKPPAPVQTEELPELQLPRAEHIRPGRKEYLRQPSAPIPWKWIALGACALIAIFFLWTRHSRSTPNSAPSNVSAASTPSTTVASAAPVLNEPKVTPSAPAQPASSPRSSSEPAPTSPTTPANRATPSIVEDPNPNEVKVEKHGDVTIRSFGTPTAKPAEKTSPNLSLIIRATENSWVSITSDGQLVTQETLIAPAHTTVRAANEIVAKIGNAAGVTFVWNGQEIPAQGAEGEVKTLVFDAQGMHESTPN
jgi:cytoskeleton protein RodZ